MAKRYFTKTSTYVLPKWEFFYHWVDAIHVNSDLFENDIKVLDAKLHITIKPETWYWIKHTMGLFFPTYSAGQVSALYKENLWWEFTSGEWNTTIDSQGNPYGQGLNFILLHGVPMAPYASDIIYNAEYTLEVDV